MIPMGSPAPNLDFPEGNASAIQAALHLSEPAFCELEESACIWLDPPTPDQALDRRCRRPEGPAHSEFCSALADAARIGPRWHALAAMHWKFARLAFPNSVGLRPYCLQ